jgi:2'-5' RNA ligase
MVVWARKGFVLHQDNTYLSVKSIGEAMIRAFISLDIPPLPELTALQNELRSTGAWIKTVEPENLHLTLRFLGEIEEEKVEEISAAIDECCSEAQPIRAKLSGVGAFPSLSYIRVVWVGVDDWGRSAELAKALNEKLKDLNLKEEEFRSHITLARVKGMRSKGELLRIIDLNTNRSFGEVEFREVRIKKSTLTKRGPIYETIYEGKLRG